MKLLFCKGGGMKAPGLPETTILRKEGEYVVVQSRWTGLIVVGLAVFFCTIWYIILSRLVGFPITGAILTGKEELSGKILLTLLAYAAPLFTLPEIIRYFRILVRGERIFFSLDRREISRNGRLVSFFGDVLSIRLRTLSNNEGANTYRLLLLIRNRGDLIVDDSADKELLASVAAELSDILGIPVTGDSD
jgi:hypothetical protein